MSVVNVYFDGIPGPDPVRYLGVFDDEGKPLNREEWREVAPDKWILRVTCDQHDNAYWDETTLQKAMRIFRTQLPSLSFSNKIRNVMQSIRKSNSEF